LTDGGAEPGRRAGTAAVLAELMNVVLRSCCSRLAMSPGHITTITITIHHHHHHHHPVTVLLLML